MCDHLGNLCSGDAWVVKGINNVIISKVIQVSKHISDEVYRRYIEEPKTNIPIYVQMIKSI